MLKEILDIFTYSSAIFIVMYIIGFIGAPPAIFITFTFILKIVIAVTLVYKFGYNPTYKYTELDRRIIIMLSIFMLVMSFTDYMNAMINDIKKLIHPNDTTTSTNQKWFG
jgi:hypothetical protein